MTKNKKVIGLIILLAIIVISLTGSVLFQKNKIKISDNKIPDKEISATVIKVVDRPNEVEDGYYGITVQDAAGQQYEIDATGYLNVPAPPDQFGEACVDVPKVKVNDKVTFRLPNAENRSNTFVICYKQNRSGYYFKVE